MGQRSVMSVFWAIPPLFLGGTGAAAGIGLINAIGNLGGWAGPSMMGWLRDSTGGYVGGLLVLAAVLIVEAVAVSLLRLPRAVLATRAGAKAGLSARRRGDTLSFRIRPATEFMTGTGMRPFATSIVLLALIHAGPVARIQAQATSAKTLEIYFIDVEGGQATLVVFAAPASRCSSMPAGPASKDATPHGSGRQ